MACTTEVRGSHPLRLRADDAFDPASWEDDLRKGDVSGEPRAQDGKWTDGGGGYAERVKTKKSSVEWNARDADGKPAAEAAAWFTDHPRVKLPYLATLLTYDGHEGKGLASRGLAALKAKLAEQGHTHVRMDPLNDTARHLNRKTFGEPVGRNESGEDLHSLTGDQTPFTDPSDAPAGGFAPMSARERAVRTAAGDTRGAAIPNVPPNRARNLGLLRDQLLDHGGHAVLISQDPGDPDNVMIGRDGKFYDGKDAVSVHGEHAPDTCHQNSALAYLHDPGHTKLYTGYAVDKSGVWVRHSWIVKDGVINETTTPRSHYFGVEMTKPQIELYLAIRHAAPFAGIAGAPTLPHTIGLKTYQNEMRARANGPGTPLADLPPLDIAKGEEIAKADVAGEARDSTGKWTAGGVSGRWAGGKLPDGATIEHHNDHDGRGDEYEVKHEGRVIAGARVPEGERKVTQEDWGIHPDFRKEANGIALKLYEYIENHLGVALEPTRWPKNTPGFVPSDLRKADHDVTGEPRDTSGEWTAGGESAHTAAPVGPTVAYHINDMYASILNAEGTAAKTPEEAEAFIKNYGLDTPEDIANYVKVFHAKRELTDALGKPPSFIGLLDYLHGANIPYVREEMKVAPVGSLSDDDFHALGETFMPKWIGSSNSEYGVVAQAALNELAGLAPTDGMHDAMKNDYNHVINLSENRDVDAFRRKALAYVARQSTVYESTTVPKDQQTQFRGVNGDYATHIASLNVGDHITANPIFSVTGVPEKAYRFAGPRGVMLSFDGIDGPDVFASSTIPASDGTTSGMDGNERETILKGGSTRAWEVASIDTWTVASEDDRPIPADQVGKLIPHYHLRLAKAP